MVLSSLQFFVSSNISTLISFFILAPHNVSFSLKELTLSVHFRIFSFLPCIFLFSVFSNEAWCYKVVFLAAMFYNPGIAPDFITEQVSQLRLF